MKHRTAIRVRDGLISLLTEMREQNLDVMNVNKLVSNILFDPDCIPSDKVIFQQIESFFKYNPSTTVKYDAASHEMRRVK